MAFAHFFLFYLILGGRLMSASEYVDVIHDTPFSQERHTPYPLKTPEENDVRSLAFDKEGRVWAATAAGVRYLENGVWKMPQGGRATAPAFKVYADRAGQVWLGTWNGLYRVTPSQATPIGMEGKAISAIRSTIEGKEGRETLFAAGPDGVWKGNGKQWTLLEGGWARSIRDILPQPDGTLWVATAAGLYRTHWDTPKSALEVRIFPKEIQSGNVFALAEDAQGGLWIGSSGGLDAYKEGVRQTPLGVKQGMPSREARSLSFDRLGRLWIATPLGVVRRQEAGWRLRHSRRWLLSDDVRDVAVAPDGTAWAATAAGVSAISQETMTLAAKAEAYRNIIRTRHIRPPGFIGPAVLVTPGSLAQSWVSDTDNDGQHTSLLCATESFRYAATKAPDAKSNAQEAFRALEALQRVTGTSHFIARTMIPRNAEPQNDVNRLYSPQERAEIRRNDPRYKFVEERWLPSKDNQWLWKRDTSSDEISGHLYAYAIYYDLVADSEEKKRVAQLVERVVGGLVDNGFVLKDIDGEATRWGVWSPERLNHDANWREERGNNSVAMLSYLRVASHITGNPRFAKAVTELVEKHGYAQNALMADYGIPSERTHITDLLLSLDYTGLLGYEANQRLRRTYQRGMQHWHKSVQNDGIPLYDFVYSRFSGRRVSLAKSAETLREWPLDLIEWTVDNRFREDVERDTTPGTGEGFLTRILPRSEMGITPWDQEPYKSVIGANGHWEEKNTSWLLAYWMGRYYGFILPPK